MPWELVLVGVAVVSYRRLGEWGVPVSDGAEVSRVDALGLLFPVVFLLAAVGAAARLLLLGLGPLLRLSRRWPTSLYLAVRRVARYRIAVVGLVAASALASGVLGYAATLNRSLDATLALKARVFVGSDVAVRLTRDAELPPGLAGEATDVDVYRNAWIATGGGEAEVSVIAIDPGTFAGATFWDATLADRGLGDILDRLDRPADGGPVAAVLAPGGELDHDGVRALGATVDARIRGVRTTRFTLEQVADVRGFPGMRRPTPTVFVAAANLAELEDMDLTGASTETWIRGDRDRILAQLAAAGTTYVESRQAGEVVDRMAFLTVAWTFDFVQAIAIAAGLLVAGGLAVVPRRPAPRPAPRLRLRPPHGADVRPAPPRPARRARRQRRRGLLAGARHRRGRGLAGPWPHRPGPRLPPRSRAPAGHPGHRRPRAHGRRRRRARRRVGPAPRRRRQPRRDPAAGT